MTPTDARFPLAKNGIYRTIQGEGDLLGVPMIFVRLAGCSVGCPECDTDYKVNQRMTVNEIIRTIEPLAIQKDQWIWLTGGEPTDHELGNLVPQLQLHGYRVALAICGKTVAAKDGWEVKNANFLSVSPHFSPYELQVWQADQINIVPGLNGNDLKNWEVAVKWMHWIKSKWVTPLTDNHDRLQECISWVEKHPSFRLGVQGHKAWGIA